MRNYLGFFQVYLQFLHFTEHSPSSVWAKNGYKYYWWPFFSLFALSNVIYFLQQTERLSVILIVSLFGELDIYTLPTPRLKSNIY